MFKLLLQLAFGYLLKDILNGMILTPIRIRSIYFLPPPPSNQRVLITSCILYIMIMIDEIIILQKRSLSLHCPSQMSQVFCFFNYVVSLRAT